MNKDQSFVLNTHFHPNVNDNGQLLANTKAGWQSSKTTSATQANIKASMQQIADMIVNGDIKDGDIITTHTQVTFTKDAVPMQTTGLVVNGEAIVATETPAADADVPF
jgi:hypothetical protein